ncbi:MAG: phosphoribosylformylglycinamidine synthase subunit PurS [Acetobacter sp.]|jgi:phosphoribosylformylglycinamidine synthase|nr:phosphoribosylformylglycinamidine synthase subunit PurS [Acetobacter sp.]MCH4060990.1 phosphoribosylformylglycinamidine synthase subunit PurS [Acetobacter sp.]MCH4087930.1 phosphoribosylformylglycinamidine synthase subunit PurS [Acetobacter sp.]MCI1293454.1 phosphoribosylformylglycinamidine synthase subunit PurS [Acetobacter sp.]MCI1319738.1 phosphoribosylformylglycinamidine synthase subunit PurS [Acetobacter sp.]
MKLRVTVSLKDGVLDPQGKAIGHALHTLGFAEAGTVRVSKVIEIDVNSTDRAQAEQRGREMAEALLANLVIEDFSVEVVS